MPGAWRAWELRRKFEFKKYVRGANYHFADNYYSARHPNSIVYEEAIDLEDIWDDAREYIKAKVDIRFKKQMAEWLPPKKFRYDYERIFNPTKTSLRLRHYSYYYGLYKRPNVKF